MSFLPIDEINALVVEAQRTNSVGLLSSAVVSIVEEHLKSEYDLSYYHGIDGWLDTEPDEAIRTAAIYAEVAGKTFADRIEEYAAGDLGEFMARIAVLLATDGHRVRGEGTLAAADVLDGAGFTVVKTWNTMLDQKVRDPHADLEGVTLPYHEMFEIDGFVASAPGLFGVAALDVNCRCELELSVIE